MYRHSSLKSETNTYQYFVDLFFKDTFTSNRKEFSLSAQFREDYQPLKINIK